MPQSVLSWERVQALLPVPVTDAQLEDLLFSSKAELEAREGDALTVSVTPDRLDLLSEGGLAAALAEMCMGGGLGIRVYVGALGRGRGFAEILFGETNGCIVVEVGESATAPFEKAMAGSPAVPIGRVLDRQILTIEADGGEILEATVGELLGAWKGPAEVAA